jgi:cyclic pyranopterin phosphate synthase
VQVRTLVDGFGRIATDLRVSLTDRCNLRCAYCMPEQGLAWLPSPDLLTDDEVVRLVRIAVQRLGVTDVRLTGGEPLLRPHLVDIVREIAALLPHPRLSLTTNGVGLAEVVDALAAAGLERVNVSLDTLDRERFRLLARRDRFDDVLAGLSAAGAAGLAPIKLNTVLMRGVNDDEAVALLDFALANNYELRFIEQMPLDPMHAWSRDELVTQEEILAALRTRWQLTPEVSVRGAAPAEMWLVDGGPARVGVIASVTQPFCHSCDRTRLTADGQVRSCLFAREETDLRTLLRAGNDDDDAIAVAWQTAMLGKRAGHGMDSAAFVQPTRPMSAIGG